MYADDLYYPTHAAIATIQYGDILQHMEIIAAIVLTFGVFLKLSILLLSTSKGISKILGFPDYRFLVIPVAFLAINYAIFSFDSMIYYHEWVKNVYPYYALVFHILLPLVLWIIVEWKVNRKKSKQT